MPYVICDITYYIWHIFFDLLFAVGITRQRIWVNLHRRRPGLLAGQHIRGVRLKAISRFHIAVVQRYDGAFEFKTCEQSLAARIREDLGVQYQIRRSSGLASDRARRHRSVPAYLEFVLEQALHSIVVHK